MKLYNEQSKKLEEFVPINDQVTMYVCGPTMYSDIHIGNARPIIFFDFVYRSLTFLGYDVKYISNVTDIDDKIINRANELGITETELVDINIKKYKEVLTKLNITPFFAMPFVTSYIDEIITYIDNLVKLNAAYVSDGDVYFDVASIKNYGAISNLKSNEDLSERINDNLKKKKPQDFTLWKSTTVGINWQSPWSVGRPGWHSECVVMINELLGEKIDIHGGGIDLQFPHHENEAAQSEACGCSLANFWIHNGLINVENEKMSKSVGNTLLVEDMIEKYGSNVVKLLIYQTGYRHPINLNDSFISQTVKINLKLIKIYGKLNLSPILETSDGLNLMIKNNLKNDFNVPNLISMMLEFSKQEMTNELSHFYLTCFKILGLEFDDKIGKEILPREIVNLLDSREIAKKEKNYELADSLREEIDSLGYEVIDKRNGVECRKQ